MPTPTTATVIDIVLNPAGEFVAGTTVTLRGVGSLTAEAALLDPTMLQSLQGPVEERLTSAVWQRDLRPNAPNSPANNYYLLTKQVPGRPAVPAPFTVPVPTSTTTTGIVDLAALTTIPAATAGFDAATPSAPRLLSLGGRVFVYTGVNGPGTAFTGVTLISGTATGTIASGQTVKQAYWVGSILNDPPASLPTLLSVLLMSPAGAAFVGFTPTGSVAAGNVQAAIAEVASEAISADVALANALAGEVTRATTQEGLKLAKASNLSDVASPATALANLGGIGPIPSGTFVDYAEGLIGDRPAANAVPNKSLYLATDESGGTLYRSNGSTWVQVASAVSAGLNAEGVQDIVGAMVSGNTETGIAVDYDDSAGKLNFEVTGGSTESIVFLASEHGLTGSGDETTAFNGFLATVDAAGGGTALLDVSVRCDGRVILPNDGASPPSQNSVRITSQCPANFRGRGSELGDGGVALDLRYAGTTHAGCGTTSASSVVTDASAAAGDVGKFAIGAGIPPEAQIVSVVAGVSFTFFSPRGAATATATVSVVKGFARITTFGLGHLEIDHLNIVSGGPTSLPFGQSTNTTVHLHDVVFFGGSEKAGLTCDEDVWVFGGTGTSADGSALSPFQGYGSAMTRVYINHVRRLAVLLTYCNGLQITDPTIWQSCGSNIVGGGAFVESWGNSGSGNTGNVVRGGIWEMNGEGIAWATRWSYSTLNTLDAPNLFDAGVSNLACHRFESTAGFNMVRIGSTPSGTLAANPVSDGTPYPGAQTLIQAQQGQKTVFTQVVEFRQTVTLGGSSSDPGLGGRVEMTGGGANTVVQPSAAQPGGSVLFGVYRSAAEAVDPGGLIYEVLQTGQINIGGGAAGNMVLTSGGGFSGAFKTWTASGAFGGAMMIDSGAGGSYTTLKGYGVKILDYLGTNTVTLKVRETPPEGEYAAPPASLAFDVAAGELYIKNTGTGTTGWKQVTHA